METSAGNSLGQLYLKRNNDHEDLLVFVRENVLDERPASPYQGYRDEQESPL